jgi:glycosyltransferase involved in cell wall biosynthesis
MNCGLLYLVGQLGAGGLERQLCYLLQSMDRQQYRPQVVVWNFHEDDMHVSRLRALKIPLHCFSNLQSKTLKLRAFRHLVLKLKPEVVHSYSFYTNFAAWWATLGTKTIAIGSTRSDFTFDKIESGPLLGRLSGRWPRSQICNNSLAAETVHRSYKLFVPRRLMVVRNGVDLQSFQMAPLPNDKQVHVLGIGSLVANKRWDRLLAAAVKLKVMGLDFLIRIVGDGPLRGSLVQQSKSLDVADRVQFLGLSVDVPGLLADANFLVHTSDSEGCPNVVVEAMACGRAVVATDAGDVPSLVEDGKTGFVVQRGDDASLVARMATLVTNHHLCSRMGQAGRAKAEREFALNRLVSQTLAAYEAMGWKNALPC